MNLPNSGVDLYSNTFDHFDPLNGEISKFQSYQIDYTVRQARLLLPSEFTTLEINAGLEIGQQLSTFMEAALQNRPDRITAEMIDDGQCPTPPIIDFWCTELIESPELPNGKPYLWSWLFAVLSLASIGKYVSTGLQVFQYDPKNKGSEDFYEIMANFRGKLLLGQMKGLPSDAIEYLGFARLFAERENAQEAHKKRGKGISKQKLENYHPLKLAVISIYNEMDKALSFKKAAKAIYPQLPVAVQQKFATEDPHNQIEKWLSQYTKGTLPGQDKLPPYTA